ncbi:N-acyl homoserine lactonase family protein [Labrys monachus]|uniref:Glyoxylase-like metal-dependent hydrolase (Beta-lactamase superfamily II) n=1 Tax=Labrys monachus TaxID=217067 RepID=A0ABU0FA54_9HYPH|nr:N-acyl homoserine lactonase family protein [Labrys monachus]MDQ0391306.1 glyoxylase-like metal-dependent hydrolase (beta-lactamase superfamily II) [Labrys monachus]
MADYSIWVLEYAYSSNFPKSGVVYGAHNQGNIKLSYCYVLIKGKGRVAMVDVGYNNIDYAKELNDRFGVENWHTARDVLGECGVTPEEVTDVFITHAHFDHMGGTDLFPNARFYLQEKELAKWVWIMSLDSRFQWLMGATDPGDIIRAVDLARQGRLVSIDGVRENVIPGIDLFPAYDTHTAGSQYVLVRNDGKPETGDGWILAGDLVYQFDNLSGPDPQNPHYVPVGLAYGSQTNLLLTTHEMIGRVGGETRRVIPVHEERLKDTFPSRLSDKGLRVIEITLGHGQQSAVDARSAA